MILDNEIDHEKISNMTLPELKQLCRELRRCILSTVTETGGHLSSNLGTVELTTALHFVFDVKTDRIVWDVGHQAYAHKLLTGRYSEFGTLRSREGISGFTGAGNPRRTRLSPGTAAPPYPRRMVSPAQCGSRGGAEAWRRLSATEP